jgi:uncharacterized protein YktA (UPF0223 family)
MKNLLLLSTLFVLVFVSGCSKEQGVDNTTPWVGVYAGDQGSTFKRLVVTKADDNSLNIQMKAEENSYYYTYGTIKKAMLNEPYKAQINEQGNLTEYLGVFNFKGVAGLNGDKLTFTCTASGTSAENKTQSFNFVGTRVK